MFLSVFRAQANHRDHPGPSVSMTQRHEGNEPESSGQKMSTPLVEESTFPELCNGFMGQMDRQRDVLVQMKRKYEVISMLVL